jgi:hypothetical protein
MPQRKPKSKPESKVRSKARPRRPLRELLEPALALPPLSAGRLRTKLSQHLGDARALNGSCVHAVAELVDGSMDEAVILRGTMWLYERTEGDAVTIAEARAADTDAKYQALVGQVKDLFEASRQPAARIRASSADEAEDVAADDPPAASGLPADEVIDADEAIDVDRVIELEAELLGEPPAAPAAASGKWVHDSKTGINHYVPDGDR